MVLLIRHRIFKLISRLLKRYGFQLLSISQVKSLVYFTLNILEIADNKLVNNKIDSIVFSKDRAMQLHAFLLSYTERVSNRGRMYIIYKCTNQRQKKSYDQLRELFVNSDFIFIEEFQFREQLIEILEKSDAGKVIFYVDDMIFTHKIDYKVFEKIDTTKYVLSLSRGKDMDFSIVLQRPLILPAFTKLSDNLECFSWNYSDKFSDWTYPLGVSGFMYGRVEISSICKSISFEAPNSLESGMQVYLLYFINRYGLCFEFASCICVHANLVQTEGKNPILGTFSIDQLLDLWENGKRINVREFYDKPINITQVKKYTFV